MLSTTPPQAAWLDGWWQYARHRPSPNHGPRPSNACIDLVVVHSISLPPGEYGGPAIEQLFTNQLDWQSHPYFQTIEGMEVSAHFVIRRDGQTVQYVSVNDRAWHAGASHWLGRDNCNDFSIGLEFEGLEGDTFTDAQYTSAIRLISDLQAILPIAHIAGHEHIAPGRKIDPGPGFDWQKMQAGLQHTSLRWPVKASSSDQDLPD